MICPRPSTRSTSANPSGSVSLLAASSPVVVGLYQVSVRHLAGLGENAAGNVLSKVPLSDSVVVEPHGTWSISSFTSTFAGFLPTVCHLPAVALASYCSFMRVTFGILPRSKRNRNKVQGTGFPKGKRHPTKSRPCRAYCTEVRHRVFTN